MVKFYLAQSKDAVNKLVKDLKSQKVKTEPFYVLTNDGKLGFFLNGKVKSINLTTEQLEELKSKLNGDSNLNLRDSIPISGTPVKIFSDNLQQEQLKTISEITGHHTNLSQGRFIPALNKYLENNKISIKLDEGGICNGLSSVYCKYALQGKSSEFFVMLKRIIDKDLNTDYSLDTKLAEFLQEVILTQTPAEYDEKMNQSKGIGKLKIDDQPIDSLLNLSATATVVQWTAVFNQIKRNGLAYTVSTPYHTIAISVENDTFRVYNPNFKEGFREFKDTKQLVEQFGSNFAITDKSSKSSPPGELLFPLVVNVVSKQTQQLDHPLPKKADLIQTLIPTNADATRQVEITQSSGPKTYDSLSLACMEDDVELYNILIAKNAIPNINHLDRAAENNSLKILKQFMEGKNNFTTRDFSNAAGRAIKGGRSESFDQLMSDPNTAAYFKQELTKESNSKEVLKAAIESGNPKCVERVLGLMPPGSVIKQIEQTDGYALAVKSGKLASLKLLINKAPINDDAATKLAIQAINSNKIQVVSYLLEQYPEIKKSIEITPDQANSLSKKTLNVLKDHELKFSAEAEAVFQNKKDLAPSNAVSIEFDPTANKPVETGFIAKIKAMIEFIIELFSSEESITQKQKDCLQITKEMRDQVKSIKVQEATEVTDDLQQSPARMTNS